MRITRGIGLALGAATLLMAGCIIGLDEVEEDAGGGGGNDAGVVADVAIGQDTASGVDTYQPPRDAATGQDQATGVDTYQPPRDAATGQDQATGVDTYQPPRDAGPPPDAARPDVGPYDAEGLSGLGESCSAVSCEPIYVCVGSDPNFFCRVPCTLATGEECDPNTEYCIRIGDTGTGACVAGNGLGETCLQSDPDGDPCAQVYICVTLSGQTNYLCRERCDPSADGGCPEGGPCYPIGTGGGGACF